MRLPRIGVLMALIAAMALFFAALRAASPSRASLAFALTTGTLMAASIRAILTRSSTVKSWWSGFSLFGWAHLLLTGSEWRKQMPTDWLVGRFMTWAMSENVPFPTRGPGYTEFMHAANYEFWIAGTNLCTLGLTLIIAMVGGVLTGWLASRSQGRDLARNVPSTLIDQL